MTKKTKLEYVWIDGYETPNIRSKTKYIELDEVSISSVPEWGFDGSSTMQAPGDNSDCTLKPVKLYVNPCDAFFYNNAYIVLCEVMNLDGTPHRSNKRSKLRSLAEENKSNDMWFGIEQEYVVMDPKTERPFGWPEKGFPSPQGRYYCGVGGDAVSMRWMVEEHALYCNNIGIPLCGTNAEVMLAQWEYQIGTAGPVDICDDLWIARYIMEILAESNEAYITLSPKPIEGDWNGSGAHINFSTKYMREEGGREYIERMCLAMGESHKEHIGVYGEDNDKRLTGDHETQHIGEFSYGDSDRGASIRIPPLTASSHRGYLEDRRPAANMNPYDAVFKIMSSVCGAEGISYLKRLT